MLAGRSQNRFPQIEQIRVVYPATTTRRKQLLCADDLSAPFCRFANTRRCPSQISPANQNLFPAITATFAMTDLRHGLGEDESRFVAQPPSPSNAKKTALSDRLFLLFVLMKSLNKLRCA